MITVGQVIKNKRLQLGKSLDVVSADTKIQKRFLEYIEKDEFSPFESEVFLKGFIKIYAEYLGLDVKKVLALYRRTNHTPIGKTEDTQLFKQKALNKRRNVLTPQLIITILLTLFSLGVVAYIFIQIHKFQTPPELTIIEPPQDITTTEEIIKVKGKISQNTTAEINGVAVEQNENGEFEKEMKLNEGMNIITVKARKNNNNVLEVVETRKITYEKPQVQEQVVPKENTIKLKITDSSAWIKLDIDSVNKIANIVEPSETEFKIEKTLHIITGKLSSTHLFFNGEEIQWSPQSGTGVAEMQCTVSEDKISCE
jgi:cytoskeletal protein RodZ